MFAALAALAAFAGFRADAAPKASSAEAEATVYLSGDFRRDFSVEYNIEFWADYRNKGWSTLAITFVGGPLPSDEVTVGLHAVTRSGHVFTAVTRDGRRTIRETRYVCVKVCRLSLRGDLNGISAYMDDYAWLQSWPRFSLRAPAPAFQVNVAVSTPGDRVTISLNPAVNTAGGRTLGMPTCAFTTRGIDVSETDLGDLSFGGANDAGARTSYFRLPDYHDWDRSAKIRDRCGTPLMIPFPWWFRRYGRAGTSARRAAITDVTAISWNRIAAPYDPVGQRPPPALNCSTIATAAIVIVRSG